MYDNNRFKRQFINDIFYFYIQNYTLHKFLSVFYKETVNILSIRTMYILEIKIHFSS